MNKLLTDIKDALEDKKAQNILIMDITKDSSVADYFVICTGSSNKNIQAISDNVIEKLDEQNISIYGKEGYDEAKWILLDYGDVVVHIFDEESREFYNLEMLLSKSEIVYRG